MGVKTTIQKIGFQNDPLEDMVAVGFIAPESVRLWMRSGRPGTLEIRWWKEGQKEHSEKLNTEIPPNNDRDNTLAVLIPGENQEPLIPQTHYRFHIVHKADKHLIGKGSFETAPRTPEQISSRFSIAIMSCNQPFHKDGSFCMKSIQMLKAMRKCFRDRNTKIVLMLGDQMYSDYPKTLSLFDPEYFTSIRPGGPPRIQDCTSKEVRRIYQARYRHFWNLQEWKDFQQEYPCYPILDDHDIVDNWGSNTDHNTAEWSSIGEGARAAYFDYQGSRVLPDRGTIPESFHYSFHYGGAAGFVMDLRSKRKAGQDGQLFDNRQENDLQDFLDKHKHRDVLVVVASVPVVHLPRFLARFMARLPHSGEDFSDRWSSGSHLRDRDWFLKTLHRHQSQNPTQRIVILSGDIHIGCAHRLTWEPEGPSFYQLVSSPVTHVNPFIIRTASKLIIRANRRITTDDNRLGASVRFLKGLKGSNTNPFGKLNFGLLEVEKGEPNGDSVIHFLLYGNNGEKPVCVFRSSPI